MSALSILSRVCLRKFGDTRSRILSNITTAAVHVGELHVLFRKGWILYEENEFMGRMYGAKFWNLTLTDKGRVELERVLTKYAERDGVAS